MIGVAGAGTMGAGIAQVAAAAGLETVLHDPLPGALERAEGRIREGLERIAFAPDVAGLANCEVVIEAAPEALDVKRDVLSAIAAVCSGEALLATNTSSLSVTEIAAGVPGPERVVGLHFFNPVPRMALVEVVAAERTSEASLARALATAESLGKRPIVVQDAPGFLVNRLGRPFYGEGLRLVQERVADPATVDRICRLGGGFRMGPFELMDLVGIDVGLAVARSFEASSFGEPRWRPSPLQARMAASGRLGRKTGAGWYAYGDGPHRPDDPELPAARDDDVSARLVAAAAEAGIELLDCSARSLASHRRPGAVGFSLAPDRPVVELTDESAVPAAAAAGLHAELVGDGPGLVLRRVLAGLVNEACFAVGEGIGTAADVDAGAQLGLGHPRGPLAWGALIGWDRVLETLDGIWAERREERHRPAPLLQRAAWTGVAPGA